MTEIAPDKCIDCAATRAGLIQVEDTRASVIRWALV